MMHQDRPSQNDADAAWIEQLFGSAAARRTLTAGSTLLDEQQHSERLHLIVDGWAYRYATTDEGARQILAILLPGDFCNLDNLLLARSDYGIRALTPLTVRSVPHARAMALAEEEPRLMRLFLTRIAVENAILGRWALGLGRQTARTRLAHFLCEVASRLAGAVAHASDFDLPLTQEKLADVLGLTSVHVNRTLQQLRMLGLVEWNGRTVRIPDFGALARIGEFEAGYLHLAETGTPSQPAAPRLMQANAGRA